MGPDFVGQQYVVVCLVGAGVSRVGNYSYETTASASAGETGEAAKRPCLLLRLTADGID
jgi:hypothetical protein